MLRAIKILIWTVGVMLLLLVGAAVAVFFAENKQWITIAFPYPTLSFTEPFGIYRFEVMSGVAAAGWTFTIMLLAAALLLFSLYLRRARQYLSMIRRLEKELVALRNLPLKSPAPLEDMPDDQVRGEPFPDDDEGDLLREDEEGAP